MTGIIYCAKCLINGKIYYGQTINSFRRRMLRHKRDALNNSDFVFHKAIRKYGWDNFEWSIKEEHISESKNALVNMLNEREEFWIKTSKSNFSEFGYNMTFGGDNHVHIRSSLPEYTKTKIRNSLLGISHTEERRRNISKSHIGKDFSKNFGEIKFGKDNPRYKFISDDDNNTITHMYEMGLSPRRISKAMNNKYSWPKILKHLRENDIYQK